MTLDDEIANYELLGSSMDEKNDNDSSTDKFIVGENKGKRKAGAMGSTTNESNVAKTDTPMKQIEEIAGRLGSLYQVMKDAQVRSINK